ncbi:hypothetical protein QAD02_023352 [Eretmocerus hayati]|uniref:Uncharacterized protein n=1 Tax=Eretmocerus hayati TaxID=131215 RepID=A0ACC2PWR2_9HYME|nr:hypothetical protein QAD02_023352 [Eretmocerus hayati]
MSVIIRLQNLAWSANALDIRQFFRGLSIPEGGVHIVGGELGDAFIAFSTDEDARQAMMQDGGKVKEMKIKLLLSSRTEMQKVIETARQQTLNLQNAFMQTAAPVAVAPNPPNISKNTNEASTETEIVTETDVTEIVRVIKKVAVETEVAHAIVTGIEKIEDVVEIDRDLVIERVLEIEILDVEMRGERITLKMILNAMAPGMLNPLGGVGMQDVEHRRPPFGLGQNPILPQNQFGMVGLNGVGGMIPGQLPMGHNVPPRMNGPLPGDPNAMNRNREPWNDRMDPMDKMDRMHRMDRMERMDNGRFPPRPGPGFPQEPGFGGLPPVNPIPGDMGAFRPGMKPPMNNPFLNKMQELDSRRNPNAFSAAQRPFDDRQGPSRIDLRDRDLRDRDSRDLEVRNMPLSATYTDVRHAFTGIFIKADGIKLITDTHGNRVGIAYVKFNTADSKDQALKGQKFVRGSEVEVLHLDETIFEKTSDSFGLPDKSRQDNIDNVEMDISPTPSSCVLVSELPPYVKEMDIAKLFHDWKINDLFITSEKEMKGIQYYAYVQFARIDDAKSALSKPLKMGNKPVMTIDRDILDYFSDVGLVPLRIHMLLNQGGKPAGECFCEFDSCEEAVRATGKNGIPLGKNVPTIELVNRNKMLETLGLVEHNRMMNHPQQHFPPHMQEPRPRFPPMHHPRFGGLNNHPFGPPGPPMRGPPGPPMMGMPPRHMMGRGMGPPMAAPPPPHVEGFGKPGCVISLENVPFKANMEEIIEFFRDFNVSREHVIRRYNDNGMPTGDARVAFESPAEAQRALRDLRSRKMRDRTIYMKIA